MRVQQLIGTKPKPNPNPTPFLSLYSSSISNSSTGSVSSPEPPPCASPRQTHLIYHIEPLRSRSRPRPRPTFHNLSLCRNFHLICISRMPLSINLFRNDEDLLTVQKSQKARGKDESQVNEIISLDKEWRESSFQLNQLNKSINALSKEVGLKKKVTLGTSTVSFQFLINFREDNKIKLAAGT